MLETVPLSLVKGPSSLGTAPSSLQTGSPSLWIGLSSLGGMIKHWPGGGWGLERVLPANYRPCRNRGRRCMKDEAGVVISRTVILVMVGVMVGPFWVLCI